MELYDVIERADLPFPTSEELDTTSAQCGTDLAVVLAGFEVVRLRERGHSAKTGRSVGDLLRGTRHDSVDHTLGLLLNQDPQGYCATSPSSQDWIDLRALAALSCTSADLSVFTQFHTNPTGHCSSAEANGAWEPIVYLTRENHTTRGRQTPQAGHLRQTRASASSSFTLEGHPSSIPMPHASCPNAFDQGLDRW
ncbi:hypothetical protein AB5J52_48770 (plasmid) [Streptomyces sp. R39]|uniref:Uncharacterized protein n=1 Tax=Streptomyces sp. R39 TaxID=3238631 RepID=A0AB39R2E8_9ACTN